MSDLEPPEPAPNADDLLVSSVLDGLSSLAESHRVASDPRLAARLAQLRAAAEAVAGPVPLVDPVTREAHLARAQAAFAEVMAAREAPAAAPPPPPPPPAPLPPAPAPIPTAPVPPGSPAPVSDLAAARARRQSNRVRILSIAAAVLVVLGLGAFLVSTTGNGGSGGDEAASSSAQSDAATEAASTAGGASVATSPEAGSDDAATSDTPPGSGDAPIATTVPAPSSEGSASTFDASSLPSLGTFAKGSDLADTVRGRLTLDPAPTAAGVDPVCQDDFDTTVTLLGRATVGGEEGLVYVEAQPTTDRHLWFVDPDTTGTAGEACRRIVPVQSL